MKKILAFLFACLCVLPQLACAELQYDTKTYTMDNKLGGWTAKYPFVSGVPGAARINYQIQLFVSQEKHALEGTWKSAPAAPLTRELNYEVTYGDNNLLSLVFYSSQAGDNDERVLTTETGWIFDTLNGHTLKWQDVIAPQDRGAINKNALTLALKKGARRDEYILYDGYSEILEIPDNYYLDNNGSLHFQFNPYEIGPYNSGVIDVDTGVVTCYAGR